MNIYFKHCLVIICSLAMYLSTAKPADAKDLDLSEACQQFKQEQQLPAESLCYQYIKGFLDGAVLTDTEIMQTLAKLPNMSAFSQRVYRTRVGKTRETAPDTYLAHFCLPDDDINEQVILSIVDSINNGKLGAEIDSIYNIVKANFPCPEAYYE
jgi:hypothetical protein